MLKTFEDSYARKDYQGALEALKVRPNEMSLGLWHYNLGLTNARLENYPEARYQFLMAEKTGLGIQEVAANDALVMEKLDITKMEKPTTGLDYVFKTVKFLSGGEFTTFALLLLLGGMISLRKNMNLRKFVGVIILASLPIIMSSYVNSWPEAVVMTAAKVQDGPSAIFGSVADVPAGVKVITQGDGEWRRVIYPTRFRGWISKSVLKELE